MVFVVYGKGKRKRGEKFMEIAGCMFLAMTVLSIILLSGLACIVGAKWESRDNYFDINNLVLMTIVLSISLVSSILNFVNQ